MLTICLLVLKINCRKRKKKDMKIRLTKQAIDEILYNGKDCFYWDYNLKGFGLKVTRKGKSYIVQSRVGKKTVRKKIGAANVMTPEEARTEAKKILGDMARGVNVNAETKKAKIKSVTLAEAYAEYKKSRRLGEKTAYDYDRIMVRAFPDWQDREIISINRDMIEKRFTEETKKTPAMANYDFRFLRALLNFAMEKFCIDGVPLMPSNPCQRLTVLRMWNRIERRDTFIRPSQIRSFFYGLTIDNDDLPHMQVAKNHCKFLLFTGCREQEAAKLKRKNIDFEDKTITFERTKNGHKHVLPFGVWLGDFLKGLCEGLKPDDFIFPANNKSGHIQDHRRYIQKIAHNCGVLFTLHDLRRTFATIVDHHITGRYSQYVIKRLLNHSQSDVTAGYIRFGVDDLRKPMQEIEDYILTQAGIKEEPAQNNIISFPNVQ